MPKQDDLALFFGNAVDWGKYKSMSSCKNCFDRASIVLSVGKNEYCLKGLSVSEIRKIINKFFPRHKTLDPTIRYALDSNIGNGIVCYDEGKVKKYGITSNLMNQYLILDSEINTDFNKEQIIIPFDEFKNSRQVYKDLVFEINGCYRDKYYTACLVLLRRLFESLIIEAYESKGIESKIKNNGQYLGLEKLIESIAQEPTLHLSKDTKKYLPKVKLFGDQCAHNRNFVAKKQDVDKYSDHIRIAIVDIASKMH